MQLVQQHVQYNVHVQLCILKKTYTLLKSLYTLVYLLNVFLDTIKINSVDYLFLWHAIL